MTNTLAQVIEFARANPKRDGRSWNGWCASFCYRAGGFSRAFPSAMDAGSSSGVLNADWRQAPAGAVHYWAGVGGDGHCAFELGGGTLLMASGSVTSAWGDAVGTISFADYARKGIPYRGWSRAWGTEQLSGTSLNAPESPTNEQETPLMKLVLDSTTGTAWYLAAPGGIVHIRTTADLASVRAVLAGNASFNQIKAAEVYLKQLRTGY